MSIPLDVLLDWFDSSDDRYHGTAVIELGVRHAQKVRKDREQARDCPLTDYGFASCAASMTYVLANPAHSNHRMHIERLRREATA